MQNLIGMEGGKSALKITTASYWRPSGRNIHRFPDSKDEDEWGVKPNKGYDVKLTADERADYFRYRRERDIVRRPGEEVKDPDPEPGDNNGNNTKTKKGPFRDRTLDKALEYVRGELARPANADRGAQVTPPAANPAAQPGTVVPTGAHAALNHRQDTPQRR